MKHPQTYPLYETTQHFVLINKWCLRVQSVLPTICLYPQSGYDHLFDDLIFDLSMKTEILCIHLGRETGSGISVPRLLQIVLKNKTLIGWLKLWSQLKVIDGDYVGKCCFSKVANSYLPAVMIGVDWCWLMIGWCWKLLNFAGFVWFFVEFIYGLYSI